MKNKILTLLIGLLLSFSVFSEENIIRRSAEIAHLNFVSAMLKMWESEHLVWRAHIIQASCLNNNDAIKQVVLASYPLVKNHVVDQYILSGEPENKQLELALADNTKLFYKTFTQIYLHAYISRLSILRKYYPEIDQPLCEYADNLTFDNPISEAVMEPWKIKRQKAFAPWKNDIFSLRVINKYFSSVYFEHLKQYGNFYDAQFYSAILKDDEGMKAIVAKTANYEFTQQIHKAIREKYEKGKQKDTPNHLWYSYYESEHIMMAQNAYLLGVSSAIGFVKGNYPETYIKLEEHMKDYVQTQLGLLENKLEN